MLGLAGNEATRLNRDKVEPEHLFVGLLCCGDARVARVLEAGGMQVDKVREVVDSLSGRGEVHGEITAVEPSSSTRGVIERAATEADRTGDETVQPVHVLLAVIQESGTVSRLLDSFGMSADAVRRSLLADSQG